MNTREQEKNIIKAIFQLQATLSEKAKRFITTEFWHRNNILEDHDPEDQEISEYYSKLYEE